MSLVEVVDLGGGLARVRLSRPEKLNAINEEMEELLRAAFAELGRDDAVSVIILDAAGRAFSVGHEVGGQSRYGSAGRRAEDDVVRLRDNLDTWLSAWRCRKPVIAQVHGHCLGVATILALCADITMVAENARIGWPKLPLGGGMIGPAWSWQVGPKKAKELSFVIGSEINGVEAARLGWANQAVPESELAAHTMAFAQAVARTPRGLLEIKKAAINSAFESRGFIRSLMDGAGWNAIAHTSGAVAEIRETVKEVGLKQAIADFAGTDRARHG